MADNKDNKVSLMASLMGGDAPEPDQDLFGEIPLANEPPLLVQPPLLAIAPVSSPSAGFGQLIIDNPLDDMSHQHENAVVSNASEATNVTLNTQQPPPSDRLTTTKAKSLLASSGLLGGDLSGAGAGGGLFDDVDREEEEREKRAEEERQKREQEELQKREQEKQLEAERERQRRLEEEQRRAEQQEAHNRRIQAEEQMMQSVNLASSAMPAVGYPQQMSAQPQQAVNQQTHITAMYAPQQLEQVTNQMDRMGMSSPMPMTFAERSQIMQQQAAASQYMPTPIPMYQSQQQRPDAFSPTGFYRPDPLPVSPQVMPAHPKTYVISSTGGAVQTHTISPLTQSNASVVSSSSRLPPQLTPSYTAGMHNSIGRYQSRPPPPIVQPPPFEPIYGPVTVSDPMLVQPPSLFNVVPPHWIYQIQTALREGGCYVVRRRFRHIVALEERLREECPGAILPPRPDKHTTRAIEEASTIQSSEFALQRCAEIQTYLNASVHHPFAGKSSSLKLFLALQDDMGTAWPEVSNNALTRLGAVSGAAVQNVSDAKMPWESNNTYKDALEDDAELLALANSEGIRMGAVAQAIPKMEGSVTLLREYGESAGAVGVEFNKLSKDMESFSDRDLSIPMDLLSQGLLRYSRRQKRLTLELSVAMNTFMTQYRLCKYEKMAFADRRAALQRRVKERGRADLRAQRLMAHQRGYQSNNFSINGGGGPVLLGELDRLERDASMSDGMALNASHQCDLIGESLKSEVNRVAFERRREWNSSMKVVCSAMKEAATEQKSIWEATRDSFLLSFPEYSARS